VLGPLPKLYRVAVSTVVMIVFIVGGAWAAFVLPYPILLSAGASVGLGVGAIAAYLLIHQSRTAAQPHHAGRHRLR
jgi:hypothetical protein